MKQIRETPDWVCKKLISKLPITSGQTILEPSIGDGKIIKILLNDYILSSLKIYGVELNKERAESCEKMFNGLAPKAKQNNVLTLVKADFLDYKAPIGLFDIIIACPPFKANIDVRHISRMYAMLKNKGMMASLTSPFWLTNNEPVQVEFRKWLKDKDYQLTLLPDNTFKEKDKNQPTAIITIYKKNETN